MKSPQPEYLYHAQTVQETLLLPRHLPLTQARTQAVRLPDLQLRDAPPFPLPKLKPEELISL